MKSAEEFYRKELNVPNDILKLGDSEWEEIKRLEKII